MKKQSERQVKDPGPEVKVGHLEETLTQFTNTTAQRLKKWKIPLLTLLVLVVAVRLGYFIVDRLTESRDLQFAERQYQLFESPATQKEEYEADSAKVEELLADVAGKKEEKFVAKAAVNYFLSEAEKSLEKSENLKSKGSLTLLTEPPADKPSEKTDAEKAAAALRAEKARDQALKIAEDTAKRHTDDLDIQSWALSVKARIEGERSKKSWLPAGRKYTLPPITAPVTPQTAPGPQDAGPKEGDPSKTAPPQKP